jgi:diguanylate cyclase (GGDEF)-like protein
MRALSRRHLPLLAGTAGVMLATALVALLAWGEGDAAAAVTMVVQVAGDLAALALSAAVAVHARGVARAIWMLAAAAFAGWLIADSVFLAEIVTGAGLGSIPLVDGGWLTFTALMPLALILLYARMRPEHGWQGALDATALTAALATLVGALALGPLHLHERVGAVQATFSVAYPVSAFACMVIVAWLVLRTGGGPRWLRLVLAALAVQFAGEAALLVATAVDAGAHVTGPWILFAAASWLWALAALDRLSAGPRDEECRVVRGTPPAWSDAIPAVAVLVAVGVVAWDDKLLGAAVVLATGIATVRFVLTSRTNTRLIATRAREARTDPLTGVLNRRGLDEQAGALGARAERSGAPLALLAIDLDGFKAVNDSRGHLSGDRLLVATVEAIKAGLRQGDVLGRTGGDEFVALLPDAGADEAGAVAERLRKGVAAVAAEHGETVTVSVGVASAEGAPGISPALMARADAALYRAKRDGRDRVVVEASRADDPPLGAAAD